MLEVPAMVEVEPEEVELSGGYVISTKKVMRWKFRLEQGGFRRARLLTFAPTSMMILPKMLNTPHDERLPQLRGGDVGREGRIPYVTTAWRIFKLLRCLPGQSQRTAASQWLHLFAGTCSELWGAARPSADSAVHS